MIPYMDKNARPERELRDDAMQWQADAVALVYESLRVSGHEMEPERWQLAPGRGTGILGDLLQHPAVENGNPATRRHLAAINRVGNWAKHEFWRPSLDVRTSDLVLCFCDPAPRRRWGRYNQHETPCQRIAIAAGMTWKQQLAFLCPRVPPLPEGHGPELVILPIRDID